MKQCQPILATRMIWYAVHNPGTLSLIVAPGLRQSMILADKIHELLNRMPRHVRRALVEKALRTVIRFRNGSQIVALPNSEHLLRGYMAHQVIVDEAAFFRNDETIFHSILDTHARNHGRNPHRLEHPLGKEHGVLPAEPRPRLREDRSDVEGSR